MVVALQVVKAGLKVAPQLALSAQSITVDELEVSMFVNRVAVPSSCHAWTHIATRMHIHTHAHTHTHNTHAQTSTHTIYQPLQLREHPPPQQGPLGGFVLMQQEFTCGGGWALSWPRRVGRCSASTRCACGHPE